MFEWYCCVKPNYSGIVRWNVWIILALIISWYSKCNLWDSILFHSKISQHFDFIFLNDIMFRWRCKNNIHIFKHKILIQSTMEMLTFHYILNYESQISSNAYTKVLIYTDNNIGLNFKDSAKVRKSKLGLDIWVWFEGDHNACINFGLVLTLWEGREIYRR